MRDEAMVQRLSRAYMRSSIVEQLGLGLALVVLPLATGCLDEDGLSLESTAAAAPGNFETNSLETSQPAQVAASEDQLPDLELSTAPAKTISTPRPPPSNLHLTSSLSAWFDSPNRGSKTASCSLSSTIPEERSALAQRKSFT